MRNRDNVVSKQAAARKKQDASSEEPRGEHGRFFPGMSGNPQGRPPGSRNRAGLLVEERLASQAGALAEKAIEMALAGNVFALRLCLERLSAARKERYMQLELPAPATAQGITAGFGKVVEALASGELTPSETNSAADLLEGARRALETIELTRQIEELESRPVSSGQ